VRGGAANLRVVDPTGERRSAEASRAMVLDKPRRRLVMMFGWQGKSTLFDDVWTVRLPEACWGSSLG